CLHELRRLPELRSARRRVSRPGKPTDRRTRTMKQRLRLEAGNPDYAILATVVTLVVIGVIFVYSSSFAIALHHYDNINYFFFRQLIAALLGLVALVFFMSIDYHRLRVFSPIIMLIAVVSLAAVLFMGSDNYGARSWIEFG